MILSDVSIRRPVFATMLNLVLIVFGLFALPTLPIDQYPNVDFPIVTATVVYPGADPESVEQRILDPLEDALGGLAGLDAINSTAYPSVAQLVIQFKLERNGDEALKDVRDKIFGVLGQLPVEAQTPIVKKFDIGSAPVVSLSISGDEHTNYGDLSRMVKDVVKPALERAKGAASVVVSGLREKEVHVLLNRERLASFNLSPADIINSLKMQNQDFPAGKIENAEQRWNLRVKSRASSADDIAALPVLKSNTSSLSMNDIADVRQTLADEESAAFIDQKPTMLLQVLKQSGANTPTVAKEVRERVAELKDQLPKGVSLSIVADDSIYITGSIDSVKLDLILGSLLATLIVLLFLRNSRVTFISALSLPTSVISTFAFMKVIGFTLNMMSTLALSLAIGILIDDAIIVIENITRHMEKGKGAWQAAQDATSEIGLAVFATTLTICAVFVPVAFMEGMVGRFFFQFGLTVAFAVSVSLFVAFTLTPMLASRLLRSEDAHHQAHREVSKNPISALFQRLGSVIESALLSLDHGYRFVLAWCLNHRVITLAGGFGAFVVSVFMLKHVPVSMFPKEDRSRFAIEYTLPEGSSLDKTKKKTLELSDLLKGYPGVEFIISSIGSGVGNKVNTARLELILADQHHRNYTQQELMQRIREEVTPKATLDGSELSVVDAQGGGGGRQEPLQFIFKSDHWDELTRFSTEISNFIKTEVPDAVDVINSIPKAQKEFRVIVDTRRSADLGISPAQVGMALRTLYEGEKVGEIEEKDGPRYDVRVRIEDGARLNAEALSGILLTSSRGEQLTLGSVAEVQEALAPSAIERRDGQRQVLVLSSFKGGDLNGAMRKIEAHIKANIPAQVSYALSGQTKILSETVAAMIRTMLLAVLLVFMILCAQYESFLAPMVIMAALPLSFTGAFGALLLTKQTLSIYGMIGLILLMGLVTKNGILLIDFTLQRIREGLSVDKALLEAGPIRLRPILMTTFAAGGGMIPVAIGHGVGGEARSPLGVGVIGGLLVSTLLTLVVVPCLYSVVMQGQAWLIGKVRSVKAYRSELEEARS